MSKIYFRQLLSGKDFAINNPFAKQMENFVYLIGDLDKKECLVVDPAWDIAGILDIAHNDGMNIVGALATHYHPDHVGGHIFGLEIEGLAKLMELSPCPIHAHKLECPGIIKVTQISANDLVPHESGDVINAGDIQVKILHTPGHTPGSCCFAIKDSLVSGDTLFLTGCGRVDLPGGDVLEMYKTIHERFKTIPNSTIIYPGHAYGGSKADFVTLKQKNKVFKYLDINSFKKLMGY